MSGVLARADLARLFEALEADGHTVIGPTVRDGAIVYDALASTAELPHGWGDEQSPGRYRLVRRGDDATFGFAVGPHSWKRWLFPPKERLSGTGAADPGDAPKRAFVGVRACELAAIDIQDRVFVRGPRTEPRYAARRERAFLVAVNCGSPSGLCFCASMGTGPKVGGGADLVLTELDEGFVVEAGTDRGRAVLDRLPTRAVRPEDEAAAQAVTDRAAANMGRTVDNRDVPGMLFANLDHPRWDDVASRCLSCTNCTLVCPTCFCSTVEEVSDLDATGPGRDRVWDSCFRLGHAAIHGANFRPHTHERYRQWLTHKFGSWVAQFGTSGCVGCGRCIAWCPTGIDVTEELAALRQGNAPVATPPHTPPAGTVVDDLVPRPATVTRAVRETADVVTLHVHAPDVKQAPHGGFHMVGVPGVGEAPISLSGGGGGTHIHTIRAVGPVTDALCALQPGAEVTLRGPYGAGWPIELLRGRPVLVIAGGIGLAPLRTAIDAMAADPAGYPDVRVWVGARSPTDVLYPDELAAWARRPNVRVDVTVDRADPSWTGNVGVVTRLVRGVPAGASALICGPEIMMRFSIDALVHTGVAKRDIWLSMERHMKCAAGFCGRCQYAHWFVCKDGPVFRFDVIEPVFGHAGF